MSNLLHAFLFGVAVCGFAVDSFFLHCRAPTIYESDPIVCAARPPVLPRS